jgi:hypothetical protein
VTEHFDNISTQLPITAVLHHFLITQQRNLYAWLSLSAICIGLFITNIPSKTGPELETVQGKGSAVSSALLGPMIGLVIATISGFTSTYTEVLMKHQVSFWTAQVIPAYLECQETGS